MGVTMATTAAGLVFVCLYLSVAPLVTAKRSIPDYIQICKRNDPQLEECILNSVEKLRPRLVKGIEELEVPGLEPLFLSKVDIPSVFGVKVVGYNITVGGASNFNVSSLRVDLKNIRFYVELTIPYLTIDGEFDVNAPQFTALPLQGYGHISANGTDVTGEAVLKAKKVERDGGTYLDFTDLKLDLDTNNYNVKLSNFLRGNKELENVVNAALNEHKRDFIDWLRPIAERVISSVLLDIAKKVTRHFTYDELFPLQ